jgi:hypothetical protein
MDCVIVAQCNYIGCSAGESGSVTNSVAPAMHAQPIDSIDIETIVVTENLDVFSFGDGEFVARSLDNDLVAGAVEGK